MTQSEMLLPEFEQEMKSTRRLIERVPDDKGEWKPHPKSFPLGHLTQLVATMPGWITSAITDDSLDLGQNLPGYAFQKTASLLEQFDRHVAEASDAIRGASDAEFSQPWSLKMNGKVIFTVPKIGMVRQNMSHLSHHRGQLTVYLRLLDVPIPSIYGPTADEKMF